jgi:hypothetical protein
MTAPEHHLVTVTRPWDAAPAVLGIFDSREEADTAIADEEARGPRPERYEVETWTGRKRVS